MANQRAKFAPRIKFKFFGRFVFAQPVSKKKLLGTLNVLAINMQFNNDLHADKHNFVMAVHRKEFAPEGTRRPDFMVGDFELALWDLTDFRVTIPGKGRFHWLTDDRPEDLSKLLGGKGQLDPNNLDTRGVFSPVNAVVDVKDGEGTATTTSEDAEQLDLVRLDQVSTGFVQQRIVDLVEIIVTPAKDEVVVTDEKELLYTIPIEHRGGGAKGSVVIKIPGEVNSEVTVSLSNLCSSPNRTDVDTEFAGLYEVLKNPPLIRQRPIPSESGRGVEFDCFKPAYIEFES